MRSIHSNGALSDIHAARSKPAARTPFEFLQSQIPKAKSADARFLDMCCGTGMFSVYPLTLGYAVEAVDIAAKSVAATQARFKSLEIEEGKATAVHRDVIDHLSANPNRYDVIQCMAGLYYLREKDVFQKVVAALKPGGMFLGVETSGDNPFSAWARAFRHWRFGDRDHATVTHLLGRADLKRLSACFDGVKIYPLDGCALMAAAISPSSAWCRRIYGLGRALDGVLLALPAAHVLAFRYGYVGYKPGAERVLT